MSELQKYTYQMNENGFEAFWELPGAHEGQTFYDSTDVDARHALMQQQIDSLQAGSAKLMADNADYCRRHLIMQRAVSWLTSNAEFTLSHGRYCLLCWSDDRQCREWREVPAEFRDIIKAREA